MDIETIKRVLPRPFDFIGIGTMKSGSTALWEYITKHPDVFSDHYTPGALDVKEPNLFNLKQPEFLEEQIKYSRFLKNIQPVPDDKLLGEFTIHYIDDSDSLELIYEHNPNVKVIAILRNPIDRTYSGFNWGYNTMKGYYSQSLKEMINKMGMEKTGVVSKSLLADKIENVYRIFPKENIYFLKYEQFKQHQQQELFKLFDFMGLDTASYSYEYKQVLLKEYVEPLADDLRIELRQFFKSDIERVESLLGWDCSDWC